MASNLEASLLLVAMPFVTSSFLLLVAMPGATSSDALAPSSFLSLPVRHLLLVAMPLLLVMCKGPRKRSRTDAVFAVKPKW